MICSVCIATYKRPELLDRLLSSLLEQVLPVDVLVEIIVVDNDTAGSAQEVVRKYNDTEGFTFKYFTQPIKNISLTRNVSVSKATGTYLLFIDDDEVASPDWVATLLGAAKEYNADGISGPVFPVFHNAAPDWIKKGQGLLVDTLPVVPTGTEAEATWTCNCLVKASLLKGLDSPFDPEYGITGGEDGELFNRLKRRGARFVSCNEAAVFEYWPPERTQVSYLVRRSLKGGDAHTRRAIAAGRRKMVIRLFMLLKAVCFGLASLVFLIVSFPSKVWRIYWKMKLASNVGRFLAVFGKYYQAYK